MYVHTNIAVKFQTRFLYAIVKVICVKESGRSNFSFTSLIILAITCLFLQKPYLWSYSIIHGQQTKLIALMISYVFCLLVGLYSVRKCENSSWGLWAKAYFTFYLDVGSLYWDKTKYILQYFPYQEALIKSGFFHYFSENSRSERSVVLSQTWLKLAMKLRVRSEGLKVYHTFV